MSEGKRRLRGVVGLGFDVVEQVTGWTERAHARVRARTSALFGGLEPISSFVRVAEGMEGVAAAAAYGSVRGVNRLARAVVEGSTVLVPPQIPAGEPWVADVESALNGAFGDFLAERGNGLDIGFSIRHGGRPVDLENDASVAALELGPRVVVFVHGLGVNEASWGLDLRRDVLPADSFGARARDALGMSPVYVRYNSGRHVSENGLALSRLLGRLAEVHPAMEAIHLVGHRMGGLVARSAAHQADLEDVRPAWRGRLKSAVCIGTPHLGAPRARAAYLVSEVLRRLPAAGAEMPGEILAAPRGGVGDLQYGYVLQEDWARGDAVFENQRLVLPRLDGVGTYYVASTHGEDPKGLAGRLLGDLLVPVNSAAVADLERAVAFDAGVLLGGLDARRLVRDEAVWEVLERFLAVAPAVPEGTVVPVLDAAEGRSA